MSLSRFLENIAAITLNYNRSTDTINCVNSLLQAGLPPKQIWVIDNGSHDDDFDILARNLNDTCRIIRNTTNLGYAQGMNLGIQQVSESHFPQWFLLLNNDTKVDKAFFQELLRATYENSLIEIFGPVILYESDPNRIWFFGGKLIPKTLITWQLYKDRGYSNRFPPIVEVNFISGCGMFIKKEVFNRIGLFNEKYFMYAEDVDFCWRANRHNIKLGVATRAIMWHKVSASADQQKDVMLFLKIKNQNDFYRSNSRGITRIIMFFFSIYVLQRYVLAGVLQTHQFSQIKTYFNGWVSGWFERNA